MWPMLIPFAMGGFAGKPTIVERLYAALLLVLVFGGAWIGAARLIGDPWDARQAFMDHFVGGIFGGVAWVIVAIFSTLVAVILGRW